jgi:hypothetical protein
MFYTFYIQHTTRADLPTPLGPADEVREDEDNIGLPWNHMWLDRTNAECDQLQNWAEKNDMGFAREEQDADKQGQE